MGLNVTDNGKTIKFSDSAGVSTDVDIVKTQISAINTYFSNNNLNGLGMSPYAYGKRTPGRITKTIIRINLIDKTSINFDCDEVLNQAGWHGCTRAALQQAESDIQSWL